MAKITHSCIMIIIKWRTVFSFAKYFTALAAMFENSGKYPPWFPLQRDVWLESVVTQRLLGAYLQGW